MLRTLIAPALAAALALGAAAPARAEIDRDQLRQFAAGAALLGIIGLAAREQNRREEEREEPSRGPGHWDGGWHDGRDDDDWQGGWDAHGNPWHNGNGHGYGHGDRDRVLPAACLRRYDTRDGRLDLLDGDCLTERYDRARRLPLSCAITIRQGNRFTSAFDPACLRREGYELGRR